jgi:alpha-beta hydrolase superfamily lysophospholipase
MNVCEKESVIIKSLGDELAGTLFLPATAQPAPCLLVCHGAGDFKENYFELCDYLSERGIASLALDMHGHGASGGTRFHVNIAQWVSDVQAAVEFLADHPGVDGKRIAAFGLSSGGTAILEAAVIEPKIRALVALDATVRNSLPLPMSCFLQFLVFLGKSKKLLTKTDLRLPLAKLGEMHLASDPEINKRIITNPKFLEAFMAFPLPGAAQAFFVDTIKRLPGITAPTLVIWGEDDELDPPETGRKLFEALVCKKRLEIIGGNGHVGHLDRHKQRVFELTSEWLLENLP